MTNLTLTIGDSVVVKKEIVDSDSGIDMSGWQGRITEMIKD